MATAPGVRFPRNASRSTGVPKTNIPYKKETADRRKRRSTASALTISGPFSLALIIVILTLTFLFSLAACATVDSPSRDGRTSAGAPLTLLPKDTSRLEVLALNEILGGSVPESLEMQFEAQWGAYSLGDDILTAYDVDQLVRAATREGDLLIMSGSQIDFAAIRSWLTDEETNIEITQYQGEEMWGDDRVAMVVLESDGYLVHGDTDAVKDLLKVKSRGTGSLSEDPENELKKVHDDAGSGWFILASNNCDEFSSELRSCEAYSITSSQGAEDYLVDITYRFLFRSEQRAESQALDIEDWLDDRGWELDIDEVKSDGTWVEAKMSGDEEDFHATWLVSYRGIRAPYTLPTAVPEPEATTSSSSTGATGRSTSTAVATARATGPQATSAPTAVPLEEARVELVSDCSREIKSEGVTYDTWDYDCHTPGEIYDHHRFYTFILARPSIVVIQVEASRSAFEVELYEAVDSDRFKPTHIASSSGAKVVARKFDLAPGEYGIRVASQGIGTFDLSLVLTEN